MAQQLDYLTMDEADIDYSEISFDRRHNFYRRSSNVSPTSSAGLSYRSASRIGPGVDESFTLADIQQQSSNSRDTAARDSYSTHVDRNFRNRTIREARPNAPSIRGDRTNSPKTASIYKNGTESDDTRRVAERSAETCRLSEFSANAIDTQTRVRFYNRDLRNDSQRSCER